MIFRYVRFLLVAVFTLVIVTVNGQIVSKERGLIKSMVLTQERGQGFILLFCENYFLKYNTTEKYVIDSIPYKIQDSSFSVINIITDFDPVVINDKVYFLENTGGGIFEFKDGIFNRIDKSYTHRLTFGSAKFVFNGQIIQYGGYGFFSNRDFFTYFDTITREWEVLSPIKGDIAPPGTRSSSGILFNNTFYLFNGFTINKFDKKKYEQFNELWSFDLDSKKWGHLGKIDAIDLSTRTFLIDSTFLLFDNTGYMNFIDPILNKITKFKRGALVEKLSENIMPVYLNGQFYCILKNINNNIDEFWIIDKNDFIGEKIIEKEFYKKNKNGYIVILYVLIIVIVVGLIVLLFFGKIRKRGTIKIKNNSIYFKNIKIELDQTDFEIISLLLNNPEGVDGAEILNITEKKGLNYSHNIRQRNIIIKNINLYFRAKVNINYDIIIINKSDYDQRMRTFVLVN